MEEVLSKQQIDHFIHNGFIKIDNAFSRETAAQAVDILWNDLPCDRNNPETWREPVIRLSMYSQQPFIESANTAVLHSAFDQLAGAGNWLRVGSMGTFPVRFPSERDPEDTGWHVDASFPGEDPGNYFDWRVNVHSKGRALLMLFLYSDVSDSDAPTRIRPGSHLDVAQLLDPKGEKGLSFMELAGALENLPHQQEILATGAAGTVYLCHPFLVHASRAHRGTNPKFMAQPPLLVKQDLHINGNSPVERAIRLGLSS